MNSTPYEQTSLGGRERQFEIDRRVHVSQVDTLARVLDRPPEGTPTSASVDLRMTVPDARLMACLDLLFVPAVAGATPAFASTLWLAAAIDLGQGPQPIEDIFGSSATPLPFVPAALWGASFSPTEEVEHMLARLTLESPVAGEWRARARWTALRPMGEIDWREARGKMSLNPSARGLVLGVT